MITSVALPYQIYQLTRSTLMVGLLSLCQLLPLLFTALLGGALADRHHRRVLLIMTECLLILGSLLLALNTIWLSSITIIFIIASFMSAVTGLHRPALDSIIQQLVETKDFKQVGALSTFKYSVCMIAGPALGGLLIAKYGLVTTYLIDFLSFVISLMMLLSMSHIPKPERKEDISTLASMAQGFKYAISRQELVGTYVVDFLAMVTRMPNALFPAIADAHGGVRTLGMLYAAPAVGSLVISFLSGWSKKIHRYGLAVAISASLWGLAIVGFGSAKSFLLVLFFLALAGAFDAVSGIFRGAMWNETIPNHLRGRLSGIEMISYLSGPKLGDTRAGLMASSFGIPFSIISGGILCVVSVLVCCYFLPDFCRYSSMAKDKN